MLNVFKLTKKNFIILIIILSILKCLLFYFLLEIIITPDKTIGYIADSAMFDVLAKNIISGHGFSADGKEPFTPMMTKDPLYVFFIVLIYSIFGQSFKNVVFAQFLLNPLIAILIYLIGKEIFEEKIARLSSLIVSFLPLLGELSFFVQTEALYLILLPLFLYVLILAFKKNKVSYYFFSGVALGLCALCRMMMFYFSGLIIILIILGYGENLKFQKNEFIKRRVNKSLIFIAGFVLIVAPWIARNVRHFKSYQISAKGGVAMWVRATMAESFTARDFKAYSLYLFSGRLAQKKYPDFIGNNFGDFEYRFVNKAPLRQLREQGFTEGEIDSILAKEGFKKAINHPFKLILFSSINYIKILKCFVPWTILLTEGNSKIERELIFPAIRFLFGFPLGIIFTALTIWGVYFLRKKILRYLPILLTILYYNFILFCITASPIGIERFVVPVIPLYAYFVSYFIFKIFWPSVVKIGE